MNKNDIDRMIGFKAEIPADWHDLYMVVAKGVLRRLKAAETTYREEVAYWYRSGDGRPAQWHNGINYGGQGYTFPYCIHGTSRWTDYDNICGGCEDPENIYRMALNQAWELVTNYIRQNELVKWCRKYGFSEKAINEIADPTGAFMECLTFGRPWGEQD